MIEDLIINKLIDRLKSAIKLRDQPNQICIESRISCEAILKIVYKNEFEHVPPTISFEKLKEGLVRNGLLPSHIVPLFDAVQRLGNRTAHVDELLTDRTPAEALVSENSLGNICNWFFNSYLKVELSIDELYDAKVDESHQEILINYEHLLRGALVDKKLDIDEYEDLLIAREDLKIDPADALIIEKKICNELLNNQIDHISDLLKGSDLQSFQKFDRNAVAKPEWADKLIGNTLANEHTSIKAYLAFYFEEFGEFNNPEQSQLLSLLGCWQGWYFQNSSKTYYDLIFLAKSEYEIIGISIEPINPNWQDKGYEDEQLLALMEGKLEDDVLFTYTKSYLLNKPWSIEYMGVLMESGRVFEGEWAIQDLTGTFNAIRSKSLLPIRIFNTENLHPVVPSQYLNRIKSLSATWLIQLTGKHTIIGIMHMIEIRGNVFANLIVPNDERLEVYYYEGAYQEFSKVTLNEVSATHATSKDSRVSFNIDWSSFCFQGTLKDNQYKLRVIKGFRI
jgi:hypothetical protein